MRSERQDDRAEGRPQAIASSAARPCMTLGLRLWRTEPRDDLSLTAARADHPAHTPPVHFDANFTALPRLERPSPCHLTPQSQVSALAGPADPAGQNVITPAGRSGSSARGGLPRTAAPSSTSASFPRSQRSVRRRAPRAISWGAPPDPRPPRPGDPADHRPGARSTPLYAALFRPRLGSSSNRASVRTAAGDSQTTPSPRGPACADARSISGL